jgi:hypothetical protein
MAHAAEANTFRGEWVRYIYATARINDTTRVLMLALSEGMDAGGRVEASRDEVAHLLSRSTRRVSSRYTDAIAAGVLEQTARGTRNRKSVFQALIPEGEQMTDGQHMFPRKQVTDSRPLSQETCDPRVSHVDEETGDPRVSPSGPITGPPGVTSYEPSIREDSSTHSELALIPVSEVETPEGKTRRLTRDQNRRISALATVYYDAVKRMGKWEAIRGVVKKAVQADYTDEQIERGLRDVAAGAYPLTANTLRVAIERNHQRPVLRAVSGGHQPYRNPTDHDVYDEDLI